MVVIFRLQQELFIKQFFFSIIDKNHYDYCMRNLSEHNLYENLYAKPRLQDIAQAVSVGKLGVESSYTNVLPLYLL